MTREEAMQEMIKIATDKHETVSVQEGIRKGWRTDEIEHQYTVWADRISGVGKSFPEAITEWQRHREAERQAAIRKLQEMAA